MKYLLRSSIMLRDVSITSRFKGRQQHCGTISLRMIKTVPFIKNRKFVKWIGGGFQDVKRCVRSNSRYSAVTFFCNNDLSFRTLTQK